jgi:hypothetical protein
MYRAMTVHGGTNRVCQIALRRDVEQRRTDVRGHKHAVEHFYRRAANLEGTRVERHRIEAAATRIHDAAGGRVASVRTSLDDRRSLLRRQLHDIDPRIVVHFHVA